MGPVKVADYRRALQRKGFRLERSTTDDFYYLYHQGKKTSVWTKISHGKGEELRAKLLGVIRGQLRLDSSNQLGEFLTCSLDYVAHLRAHGVVVAGEPAKARPDDPAPQQRRPPSCGR